MGAYSFVQPRLNQIVSNTLKYHGREPLAAPATGIGAEYKKEQAYVIQGVFEHMM